jgi:hypothetical protein
LPVLIDGDASPLKLDVGEAAPVVGTGILFLGLSYEDPWALNARESSSVQVIAEGSFDIFNRLLFNMAVNY